VYDPDKIMGTDSERNTAISREFCLLGYNTVQSGEGQYMLRRSYHLRLQDGRENRARNYVICMLHTDVPLD
jgi:hypothetical protein